MGTSGQLAAVHRTHASGVRLTVLLDAEPLPPPIYASDSVDAKYCFHFPGGV